MRFDFDHIGKEKNGGLSNILQGNNWERIKKELDLCEVVCANCHRTRTKERFKGIKQVKLGT